MSCCTASGIPYPFPHRLACTRTASIFNMAGCKNIKRVFGDCTRLEIRNVCSISSTLHTRILSHLYSRCLHYPFVFFSALQFHHSRYSEATAFLTFHQLPAHPFISKESLNGKILSSLAPLHLVAPSMSKRARTCTRICEIDMKSPHTGSIDKRCQHSSRTNRR